MQADAQNNVRDWLIRLCRQHQRRLQNIGVSQWADFLHTVLCTQRDTHTLLSTLIANKQFSALDSIATIALNLPKASAYVQAIERTDDRNKDTDVCIQNTQGIQLATHLYKLKPWRKGPFLCSDICIDAEWNCFMKWQRFHHVIADKLYGAHVLDIGGGNGYYARRVLLSGAQSVTVVDPNPLAWAQASALEMIENYQQNIAFIPCTMQDLPKIHVSPYTVALCLGVLYHSPAPFSLLRNIKKNLAPNSTVIIETLVVDGDENSVFTPTKRYAAMPNVWAIPSVCALCRWLQRCGFHAIDIISQPQFTSVDEQRATKWSSPVSLIDALDSRDHTKTKEGWCAPMRAIVKAIT